MIAPGQLRFGLVPERLSTVGYCVRCNATYRDILTHRTAVDHRRRSSTVESGAWLRGRSGGSQYVAMLADPYGETQFAAEDMAARERRQGIYPRCGQAPIFEDWADNSRYE